ncbi:HIT-like protein HinT [Serratia symbiotica]|nr:HIT-like protein HinT [Serratia symbiotica]
MTKEKIFSKIIHHQIPANIIYQDELITAFHDILPQAPIHILIIPNILIPTINDITIKHEMILSRMILSAKKIAKKEKIEKSGYRLVINCNDHAGQDIYYLHMHLIGGRPLGPMLQTFSIK